MFRPRARNGSAAMTLAAAAHGRHLSQYIAHCRRAAQSCEASRKEGTERGERWCGLGHPQSRRNCLATNSERVDLVHATVCTCLRAASDARTGRPTREGEPGGGGVPLQRNWLR